MANICYRSYIKWNDSDEAERDGKVLVLTSPSKTFVDVRLKPGAQGIQGVFPISAVEWAFAGHSETWLVDDDAAKSALTGKGNEAEGQIETTSTAAATIHSRWHHTVDSHHVNASSVIDQGTLVPQPDGITSLESGTMIKPATGKLTAYEEAWVDLPIVPDGNGEVWTVVLQIDQTPSNDESGGGGESQTTSTATPPAHGVIVRIGNRCQGLLRIGDRITIEQWEKSEVVSTTANANASSIEKRDDDAWKRVLHIGDDFLPCAAAFDASHIAVGNTVRYGSMEWKFAEVVSSTQGCRS